MKSRLLPHPFFLLILSKFCPLHPKICMISTNIFSALLTLGRSSLALNGDTSPPLHIGATRIVEYPSGSSSAEFLIALPLGTVSKMASFEPHFRHLACDVIDPLYRNASRTQGKLGIFPSARFGKMQRQRGEFRVKCTV
ncbi:uncharacterized protein K444DRAFT_611989 [Hyaloscypha bicolor E]|uniref:Uncharacterized protein n=1 Tax=Hyaloscypha bicolor E TaxID=1095630 RepID=A0A2J6TFF3_9HELO|nr:uncharacterized protein K444DRAFT_611989 [Hyaloscypha bicolor E]PMD61746.1 hypothetical protein K444DRAFT_611989 [Hyaloscypha bicolor E]